MEFYLDILQAFTTPKENIFRIVIGAKFMLATKVTSVNHNHIIFDSRIEISCACLCFKNHLFLLEKIWQVDLCYPQVDNNIVPFTLLITIMFPVWISMFIEL